MHKSQKYWLVKLGINFINLFAIAIHIQASICHNLSPTVHERLPLLIYYNGKIGGCGTHSFTLATVHTPYQSPEHVAHLSTLPPYILTCHNGIQLSHILELIRL